MMTMIIALEFFIVSRTGPHFFLFKA